MSINNNSDGSIWKALDITNNKESQSKDKIEFGDASTTPDSRTAITGFHVFTSRSRTDNGAPDINIARRPDTGFRGTMITLDIFFKSPDGRPGSIAILNRWLTEDNHSDLFRHGLFGLRFDKYPQFNLNPTPQAGFKFSDFRLDWDADRSPTATGQIVLELSGLGSRLGKL